MALRIIFMGTPDFAVPTLQALTQAGHAIAAVYTRTPKPAGRGMALQVTPVERLARELGLPVLNPRTLRTDEAVAAFRAHKADVAVVVAYGLILPPAILDGVPHGCFNLHASLLPRWRGAAPINRAIMAGDAESGVMVMKMDAGLDTGDVAMTARLPISATMTAGELHDGLAPLGAELMVRAMAALESGTLRLTPQGAQGVTYAAKIDKSETRIDWRQPAHEVHNHCRGLSPFPGAWCELPGGNAPLRLKVLRTELAHDQGAPGEAPGTVLDERLTVACGEGAVRILELQRAGKQPMMVDEFLRGVPVPRGARLD